MDFELTSEQKQILLTVDRLMQRHYPPEEIRRRDAAHADCRDMLPVFAEAGLLALPFPKQYGGLDADRLTVVLVQERLARHGGIAAIMFGQVADFGGMSLLCYGTEGQRSELLPRAIRGELVFSFALTEAGAGSDAAAAVTSASKTEKGWTINGRKIWISNAGTADYLVTMCRTTRGSKGKEGLSTFLVPRDAPGIHMTRLSKVGNNCMSSWDIGFDNVEVTDSTLMGEQGKGMRNMMTTLQYSRTGQAAMCIGVAQAAVDSAKTFALERRQFDRRIADFQVIRHRLVDMQSRVDQARLMLYQASWLTQNGRPSRKESAQAKVLATEALEYVSTHGMQIQASFGYSTESDIQRYWRDARLYTFGEGTNELQRDLIAKEIGL
ncbi:MAG: acyl-CoA dehydrogenase family protein [Xanthobacteraceae bacterium]